MKAASLLLCMASLAHGQQAPPADELQRITVQLYGAPAEKSFTVERELGDRVPLVDNAAAVREGVFEAVPARSVQLRLLQLDEVGEIELWSGLAMLTDRSREVLAFSYQVDDQYARALRVPAAPSLHVAAGQEPVGAYRLAMGWGALVLAYLGIMVVGWAIRSRRQGSA